ncbi:MAG: diphosphate--fructose-6-phosphate 1-phosphotransferase [bacterium]|jgi:pyrophosphate--fructose-6-phosphate 1-phosphotransferase|nr:diphosphate--fructose-6-phosphate 1-phosphotransferase [bacterium]MDD3805809.1 diphosphate--fructose-6-phosphate 1-phosphotransferase [bacterium]MDD4152401.1 diphosphate--fructose-6-phosphate 1-phosphotransferase [bacterium]MDD4557357.1 diphosphate--fructose-6-phosphate 1-phosphotransferase [bacterium]
MDSKLSALQAARSEYTPKLPKLLKDGKFTLVFEDAVADVVSIEEIRKQFPESFGKPLARFVAGEGTLSSEPMSVGVVLSGGQAPGGHNVIAGLLDALKAANEKSRLIGFLGGPAGIVKGKYKELTPEFVAAYRNTGGFDIIGSGRDKIEKIEELEACRSNLEKLGIKALVVIGGDDSNTNAALMAEYFTANNYDIRVIGVPKTIDGDMKNEQIEISFGFDTASKTFAELVGNICRDAMSACKYWHFIRLMGRAASHITLEVALQTHPNIAIISEEVEATGWTLSDVVDQIVTGICKRAEAGKNYGIVLIPEGLLEFLADVKGLIAELGKILDADESYLKTLTDPSDRRQHIDTRLTSASAKVYGSFPDDIQQVLLRRDKHGNLTLSQIETEKLLIDLVTARIRLMQTTGEFKGKFAALNHFFGYEGRCVAPSNFDADYTYTLGYTAALLLRAGLTGYTVSATNLAKPVEEWVVGGVPVASMLTMELRKGKMKPVIKKALVDVNGNAFKAFAQIRDKWLLEDAYVFPGPIQYFGPCQICDATTKTLQLECGDSWCNANISEAVPAQ